MTLRLPSPSFTAEFVNCLESLPHLHTLEVGLDDSMWYTPRYFGRVLENTKFPQIKALVLPPAAYPLLKHCINVEEVNWVSTSRPIASDEFLGSLATTRDSKIRRMTIPLIFPGDPSRK